MNRTPLGTQLVDALAWLDGAGDSLAAWLVWINLWVLGLVLVVFVLDRVLARRVSAAWRIALYSVVVVRLVLPIGWTTPMGVIGPTREANVASVGAQLAPSPAEGMTAPPLVDQHGAAAAAPAGMPARSPLSWRLLVVPLYAAGVGALLLVLVRRGRAARRLVRQSAVWTGSEEFARGVDVRVHPSAGPVLVGVLRPRVVVAAALTGAGAERELRAVLAHERAHVRRGDPVLAMVLALATVVLWPIVGVWLVAARVRLLMEQAADELALRGVDAPTRAAYGAALVRIADGARRTAVVARLVPAPALGFTDAIESRVRALARGTRRWGSLWQAGAVGAACAAMIACAGPRASARGSDEPPLPEGPRQAATKSAGAPTDDRRIVHITVLSGVPKHPKLPELAVRQREETGMPEVAGVGADGPVRTVPTLSAAEAVDVVRVAGEQGVPAMLTPSQFVQPGVKNVGHQAFEDVATADGVVTRAAEWSVSVQRPAGTGAPANSSIVSVEYRERENGQDRVWGSTGNVIVPHGQSVWMYAHGKIGAPMRLILISAEPAPDETAQVDLSDPDAYPLASTMVWVMELREPPPFDALLPGALREEWSAKGVYWVSGKASGVVVNDDAAPGAAKWIAGIVPGERLPEFGDALRKAGGRHVASPALIGKVGAALKAAPGSLDKAHSSLGPYGLTLSTKMAKGDAAVLTGIQEVTLADGTTRRMATFDHVRLEKGDALAVLQPPAAAGGAWLVTVYNPQIVTRHEEYPFQTSEEPNGGGRGVNEPQEQVAPRAR